MHAFFAGLFPCLEAVAHVLEDCPGTGVETPAVTCGGILGEVDLKVFGNAFLLGTFSDGDYLRYCASLLLCGIPLA